MTSRFIRWNITGVATLKVEVKVVRISSSLYLLNEEGIK